MVQSEGHELCHLDSHTPDLSLILEGTQSFLLLAGHVEILLDVQLRDLAWLCIDTQHLEPGVHKIEYSPYACGGNFFQSK